MRVGLFVTCLNDVLYPRVALATTALLERLGVDVRIPRGQTCCGQMHFNTGYRDACVPLVDRFVETFAGYDAIVTPSASCAAMVRHQYPVVAGDRLGASAGSAVEATVSRVYELCEFLIDVLGVVDVGASFAHTVALHTTCHSRRLLGIGDRQHRLLAAVRGLTLVEPDDAEQCCGFGGTFAVKNSATSVAMADDKVDAVLRTGASVLTAADASCLMHLDGRMSRRGERVRVMHLAEILASTDPPTDAGTDASRALRAAPRRRS